jgi:hypothetical protein
LIYCVVPPELADELYDKLTDHYKDNPNVQVIVDRRVADRRAASEREHGEPSEEVKNRRQVRERRRDRPGTFPVIEAPSD